MSVTLNINGNDYFYPEQGDISWGPDATDWAVAVTSGMLQKAGGAFTLLDEVDFGPNYGLKSSYFKSRTPNPAAAGSLRLARTDTLSWRNEANDGDLALSVNSSNELLFNGNPIGSSPIETVANTSSIDLTITGTELTADLKLSSAPADGGYINSFQFIESDGLHVQVPILIGDSGAGGSAGVAPAPASGDAAAGKFLKADGTWEVPPGLTSDEFDALSFRIYDNADDSKQIAFSASNISTSTTRTVTVPDANVDLGSLTNSNISAAAAIAFSKMASLTASRALVSDGSGVVSASSVTATELGYVSGVTSSIQTQIDSKQATITGAATSIVSSDLTASRALQSDGSGKVAASAVTSTELGYVSGVTSALQTQLNTKVTNPMTTGGDLIYGGASGTPTRLANGSAGQVLMSAGGTSAPAWSDSASMAMTDWTSFTPTGSWVSNCTYSGRYRRVGDTAHVQIALVLSGAPTSTGLTLNLPAGLVIDSSKLLAVTVAPGELGRAVLQDTGSNTYAGAVLYSGSTAVSVYYNSSNTGGAVPVEESRQVTQAAPYTFTTNDTISVEFFAPIVGWSSAYSYPATPGVVLSDWTSFTPTGSWVSNTTYTGLWSRVGDKMYLQYQVAVGGSIGSPGPLYLNLPSGYTIDTNKLTSVSAESYLDAVGGMLDAGSATFPTLRGRFASTSQIAVVFGVGATAGAPVTGNVVSETTPVTPASGDRIWMHACVPISGWSSVVNNVGAAPTVQRFTSGSGTYTTPANVKYIEVEMVAGGGGGAGGEGNASNAGNGGTGGTTSFGTSLLTATGGAGGSRGASQGGAGGTATVNSPAISIIAVSGGMGNTGYQVQANYAPAGGGGNSALGGGGTAGQPIAGAGGAGATNTGAGGGGGTTNGTAGSNNGGAGGGAGGYIKAQITSPSSSYSYSVGAAGTAGTAGSNGGAGGAGGSGIIIVREYY